MASLKNQIPHLRSVLKDFQRRVFSGKKQTRSRVPQTVQGSTEVLRDRLTLCWFCFFSFMGLVDNKEKYGVMTGLSSQNEKEKDLNEIL